MKLITTLFLVLLSTQLLAQVTTCDFSYKRISITINENTNPGVVTTKFPNGPEFSEEVTAKYFEELYVDGVLVDTTIYFTDRGTKVQVWEPVGNSSGLYVGYATDGHWPLSNCKTTN